MAFENVCKQSLLYEGELVPCKLGDQEIVIMWPDGGTPKAYEARCPHEGVSLGRGDFNGRILYCTAHGWVFDGHSGQCLQPTGWAMNEYPMRIENGHRLVAHPRPRRRKASKPPTPACQAPSGSSTPSPAGGRSRAVKCKGIEVGKTAMAVGLSVRWQMIWDVHQLG